MTEDSAPRAAPRPDTTRQAPAPADSAFPALLAGLPARARPFAALSRLDRPVGFWLLVLPAWMGLAFTRISTGFAWIDLVWILAFAVGALVMRGAGCTWNDITDRELDAGVARTADRPLPSGQVSVTEAAIWMGAQLFVAFLIWLFLPLDAKIVAALALPVIAAYPFMKRVTWWPQAWLGMAMNWGALVAAATVGHVSLATVLLWLGLGFWTIAYDTIYALQDREDDALIGVKSTARLFGERARLGAFCFHMAAAAIVGLAALSMGADKLGGVAAALFLVHGVWQLWALRKAREANALAIFKSNVWAGAILLAGFTLAALIA